MKSVTCILSFEKFVLKSQSTKLDLVGEHLKISVIFIQNKSKKKIV